MSDDLQPSRHAGDTEALPGELLGIYRQLERDSMAWSSHVPDTAGLKDFVATLAAGNNPQPVADITYTGKEFTPMQLTDDFIETPTDHKPAPNLAPMPKRPRSFTAPVAAVLLVILLVAAFVWRTHQQAAPLGANATATSAATSDGLPAHATFTSSSLLGGGDIWQAGTILQGNPTAPTGGTGFVAHYTKGHWQVIDNTSFSNVVLNAIGMSSDNEGWALGLVLSNTQPGDTSATLTPVTTGSTGILYHYIHGHWQKTNIMTVAPLSATFQFTAQNHVWLLVSDEVHSTTLHYDGAAWKTVTTPDQFGKMAMLSDIAGWFGGAQSLWHFQDGQFTNVYSVAGTGNVVISDLSFTAPNDGWALVTDFVATNESQPTVSPTTTILHFADGHWALMQSVLPHVPSPTYVFTGLSMYSSQDGWGIITEVFQNNRRFHFATQPSYLAHYQDGTWQLLQTPTGVEFTAIDMSTTTDGWATGIRYAPNGGPDLAQPPVILRYQDGAWNVVG